MVCEYDKLADNIKETLLDYVQTQSHTNTEKENNVIGFFERWFNEREYFKKNPNLWGFYPIEKDPFNRKVPWGLVKGKGDKTIILIHHCDTVDDLDYGPVKELAYKPEELAQALKEGALDINEEVKRDLESDGWLFGRGVADMKGGGAIQLSLIDKYSQMEDFNGNLLVLALPDEENLSAGMRSAVYLLKELKEKYNLDYVLMIDSEPHERQGEEGVLYDGSIGKVMPIVYVRGRLSHVGQIFSGFNPNLLLSEIVRRTELNTDFMDVVDGEATPPPTWLYFKDRKNVYDVSLPISAAGYMSILTFTSSPKDILERLEDICKEAFADIIDHMNRSYREYCKGMNKEYEQLPWQVKVKRFSHLFEEAKRDSGDKFIEDYNLTLEKVKGKIEAGSIDMAEACYQLIEKTLEYVHDLSPVVVIALSPPYYPHVSNDMIEVSGPIKGLVDHLIDFADREWEEKYRLQRYYNGISDLSYAMFPEKDETIQYIKENMIMWDQVYGIPLEIIKELSIPVINIGPWGKDIHKNVERVYKEDLFYRTPRLIEEVINKLLV